MISIFLHLLVLAFGTAHFSGIWKFLPLTFMVLWIFSVLVFLTRTLPLYVENKASVGAIPPFGKAQTAWQWGIVVAILLLHAVSDPADLMFSAATGRLKQTLPMLISIILYVGLLRCITPHIFKLFKAILVREQTAEDFFRARMSFPILFFPPILLWMLMEDLLSGVLASGPLEELKMLVAAPVFFLVLYMLSPRLFNWAWRAEKAKSEDLNNMVKEVSQKAQTQVSGIKIWDTFKEPVPNAAVAGLLPRFRFVYVTSYLVKLFPRPQLAGVIAHELGHLKLGHVFSYMIYSLDLVALSVAFKLAIIVWYPQYMVESVWASMAELLVFVALFVVSFTAIARRSEFAADAFAVAVTGSADFVAGLETLQAIIPPPPKIPSWLLTHPQIQDRIEHARTSEQSVENLVKKSRKMRYALLVLGVIMMMLAAVPGREAWQISKINLAARAKDGVQLKELYDSLPGGLKEHPLVVRSFGSYFLSKGSWGRTLLTAAHAQWNIRLMNYSEEPHHAIAPEVALDLKFMKFVLQTLDLW